MWSNRCSIRVRDWLFDLSETSNQTEALPQRRTVPDGRVLWRQKPAPLVRTERIRPRTLPNHWQSKPLAASHPTRNSASLRPCRAAPPGAAGNRSRQICGRRPLQRSENERHLTRSCQNKNGFGKLRPSRYWCSIPDPQRGLGFSSDPWHWWRSVAVFGCGTDPVGDLFFLTNRNRAESTISLIEIGGVHE
jgi:hypothetical protein